MTSIVQDLMNPESFPDATQKIAVVQTHISMVFVADHYVYKVKKPVNFGFLDFSTLEKRLHYCHREVSLNRRLARDVYLDVVPVTFYNGKFSLKKTHGEIVDYAVKMRRVPENRLMKFLFKEGKLTEVHVKNLAEILSKFHSSAQSSSEIDRFGTPESFKINTD